MMEEAMMKMMVAVRLISHLCLRAFFLGKTILTADKREIIIYTSGQNKTQVQRGMGP